MKPFCLAHSLSATQAPGGFLCFLLALPLSIISLWITHHVGGFLLFILLNTAFVALEVKLLFVLSGRR